MPELQRFHRVFGMQADEFDDLALEIFHHQAEHNAVYRAYISAIGTDISSVRLMEQIPFLPIGFFKTHKVQTGSFEPATIFESSGTTGTINSRHFVADLALYEESFRRSFELFYGPIREWCIIGLLPSYLERSQSSLVFMVDSLIESSEHPQSGFYLYEYEKLSIVLAELEKRKQKTFLIGVGFALVDLAEQFPLPLMHTIIMETGGMKGRRQEMVKAELHELLKKAFHLPAIHSEYGMTELLSQAYSKGEGIFQCPPWMKVLVRDEEEPLLIRTNRETNSGVINVIDLANIHSCSFIATDDVGKVHDDGSFEVLGRMDGSDLRGCSLLIV